MNTYPLFRTRATLPTATPPATLPEMTPSAHGRVIVARIDDVTDWVGRDVTPRLYEQIIKRVSALGWTMDSVPRGELIHITRLTVKDGK